jgi:hypothetical protein
MGGSSRGVTGFSRLVFDLPPALASTAAAL